MIAAITVSEFVIGVLVFLFGWYIAIIAMYYRREFKDFLKGKSKAKYQKSEPDDEWEPEVPETTFEELEQVVTDIRHSILEVAGKEANKAELLMQLKARLANYSGLRLPAYQIALNNFIIQHAESICGVVFSEQELEEEWEKLPR